MARWKRRRKFTLRPVAATHLFPADVLRAIHDDDPRLLDDCIARSLDLLYISDAGGSTLLHLAARFNALKVAGYLFERWDFPTRAWDFAGWEAIHEAVSGGHVDMVRLLYEAGADLESQTFDDGGDDGRTPLTLAVMIAMGRGSNPAKDPTVRAVLALIRPKGSAR